MGERRQRQRKWGSERKGGEKWSERFLNGEGNERARQRMTLLEGEWATISWGGCWAAGHGRKPTEPSGLWQACLLHLLTPRPEFSFSTFPAKSSNLCPPPQPRLRLFPHIQACKHLLAHRTQGGQHPNTINWLNALVYCQAGLDNKRAIRKSMRLLSTQKKRTIGTYWWKLLTWTVSITTPDLPFKIKPEKSSLWFGRKCYLYIYLRGKKMVVI